MQLQHIKYCTTHSGTFRIPCIKTTASMDVEFWQLKVHRN